MRRLEPGCSSESSGVTFLRFKLVMTFFCWMLVQKDNSLVQGKQLSMVLIDLSRNFSLSLCLLFYFCTFWSHNWNNAYQTLSLFSEFFIGLIHETYCNFIFFSLNYRYHLKGPKKGSLEVINNNLPGIPDNIRRSSTGGYWIGMALIRKKNKISFIDYCAEKPWLRALIMKVSIKEIITFKLLK